MPGEVSQTHSTTRPLLSSVESLRTGSGMHRHFRRPRRGPPRHLTMTVRSDRYIEVRHPLRSWFWRPVPDNAHPAFSKMFVETEIADDNGAIAKRRALISSISSLYFVTPTRPALPAIRKPKPTGARLSSGAVATLPIPGRWRNRRGWKVNALHAFDPIAALTS